MALASDIVDEVVVVMCSLCIDAGRDWVDFCLV